MRVYVCIYIYIYMYIDVYIYIYIYIHIHTHTYTHTRSYRGLGRDPALAREEAERRGERGEAARPGAACVEVACIQTMHIKCITYIYIYIYIYISIPKLSDAASEERQHALVPQAPFAS